MSKIRIFKANTKRAYYKRFELIANRQLSMQFLNTYVQQLRTGASL
jgi:hypothetical protein